MRRFEKGRQSGLHRFQEKLQRVKGNQAVDPEGHDGVKSERPHLRIPQFVEIRPGTRSHRISFAIYQIDKAR